MVADEPDEVWNIILGILGEDDSEIIVKAVGAGPLEDLMVLHGEEFIDKVESEAFKCKTFKEAMKYTWLDGDDTKVCTRFFAIAGIEKPF